MELSDGMDIAAYSVINSQIQSMQLVSTAVLAKTMDMAETQGAQIAVLMEQSVNPDLGANIDIQI